MPYWQSRPLTITPFVFFDIETTGLRPDRGAQITEIAVVGRENVRFEWKSPDSDSGDAEGSTGQEGSRAIDMPDLLTVLFDHLQQGVVVGHHLHFDLRFVTHEAGRYGCTVPKLRFVDTLALARRLHHAGCLPAQTNGFQLATLLDAFDIEPCGDLHTATVDATATRALFWALVSANGLETLADAGTKLLAWSVY